MRSEGEGDTITELLEAVEVLVASLTIELSPLGITLVEKRIGEVCT